MIEQTSGVRFCNLFVTVFKPTMTAVGTRLLSFDEPSRATNYELIIANLRKPNPSEFTAWLELAMRNGIHKGRLTLLHLETPPKGFGGG